jgi:hypothetical protein
MDTLGSEMKELSMKMRPKIRYWLPAAAMDERDLRLEIEKLYERGFGGVEVVVLATLPDTIARSEDGWGTKNWNDMVRVIADETKKHGMSMDLAIGPGWPIASPAIRSADDPAALYELTWGCAEVKDCHYKGKLPERRVIREEGTPRLVHALAYLEIEDHVLLQSSYLDLRAEVKEGILCYDFPEYGEGKWKVFAFYSQPSCHKVNSGQTYAVDHLSWEGAKACETYWDHVFAEDTYDSMESFFCDSMEYNVALDWTPDFLREFENRRGYSLLPYLPFIGLDNVYPACDLPGYRLEDASVSDMVNSDYTETLTQCYCENHLETLERIAEKYGKTIRYQVAYNKPFEEERSGLYVAIPENEALGRAFLDGQKLMAASAHLGRKERYSFECAAQFGHSYGQSYEDLFWWVKRSLMAGMNAQVLHGASYSGGYHGRLSENGQIPGTQWPGYEAFGKFVSNYWNRTPSVEDARKCMDTITRLNTIFRKKAKVDCAVFRCSYSNDGAGSEHAYYPDGGKLMNRGCSYEPVSDFLLHLPVCKVTNGILDEEGVGYQCLIIPEQRRISASFLKKAKELAENGLPVIWVGKKPEGSLFFSDVNTEEKRSKWNTALEEAWNLPFIKHVDIPEQVPDALEAMGIRPRVILDGDMDIMTAVREDEANKYYALYGYNRVEFTPDDPNPDEVSVSALYRKGTTKGSYERPGTLSRRTVRVKLKGNGKVSVYDPWTGKMKSTNFCVGEDGYMEGYVRIEEDELLLLVMHTETVPGGVNRRESADQRESIELRKSAKQWESADRRESANQQTNRGISEIGGCGTIRLETLELEAFEPCTEGEVSFLRSGFTEKKMCITLDELLPWKDLSPELIHFSGRGIYKGSILLDEKEENCRYLLKLGDVSDTFTVRINGVETDFPDQVLKQTDVTELLHTGENALQVTVTSNLYNRLFHENMTTFNIPVPYLPRKYGIWETEGKKVELIKIK